jgi:predicted P-loop ATPase
MNTLTPQTRNRPRLDVALEAASNGYWVFPCGDNKKPRTPNGWKNATQDPTVIRNWWTSWPNAIPSIAVCDGVVMLDFDTKPEQGLVAAEVFARVGWTLPETYRDETSGGGFHLWFQYPDTEDMALGFDSAVLGIAGFDVRSNSGYSCIHFDCVPPPRAQLAELPMAYHALLPRYNATHQHAAHPVELDDYADVETSPESLDALDEVAALLLGTPRGKRNDVANAQGYRAGLRVGARSLAPAVALAVFAHVQSQWSSEGSKDHSSAFSRGLQAGASEDVGASIAGAFRKRTPTLAADAPHSDVEAGDVETIAAHNNDPNLDALSRGSDGRAYLAALLASGVLDVGVLTALAMRHASTIGVGLNATNARRSAVAAMTQHTRAAARAADAAAKQAQQAQRAQQAQQGGLRTNSNNRPESTFGNVVRALSMPPFDAMFWTDSFKRRVMVESEGKSSPLTDALSREIRVQLDAQDVHPTAGDTREAIYARAAEDQRNPITDYFDSLSWDGTERFSDEARALFGAAPDVTEDAYNARCLMWWMMSAVVRARKPGSKADSMLVLYAADGGEGKTELLRALCPDESWFNPAPVPQDEKRSIMVLPNYLIHEMAEMPTWKNHVEYMTFIDRRRDTGVRMHGTELEDIPRQCVFFGNTNVKLYLVDRSSENRRFWTLEVRSGRIDLARVKAVAPQLWAEADAKITAGVHWWPTAAEQTEIGVRNQQYLADDSVEDAVYQVIVKHSNTEWSASDLLEKVAALCFGAARPNGTNIGLAMIRFGWVKRTTGARRCWVWHPSAAQKKHAVPPRGARITDPPKYAPPPSEPVVDVLPAYVPDADGVPY